MIATANKPPEFAFPSPSSPTMEDFFDISQFGPQSSRESSHSPSSSTHPLDLPPTPPQQTPPSSFLTDVDANLADVFFRSYLAAEANKAASSTSAFLPESPFQPSPSMAMSDIYDPQPSAMSFSELFPSYSGLPLAAEPSLFTPPSSAISAPSSSASPLNAMPFAIDPQLVASPSPTAPTPGPSGENATDDEGDDDDDLDEDEEPLFLKAAKGGKVSKIKRPTHTVASGGVVKRTSAAVSTSKSFDKDSDDWRPSPEEYKKLSSKEKRQLRNKISARNFRVRRKEYITTLESHIADRDRLIEAIREELGNSQLENLELRKEVDALKAAMLDGRASSASLPPPVPLDSNGVPIQPAARKGSALARANPHKDVAANSPRNSQRSFWGGAASIGGGVTPVHATLIPDIVFPTASVLSGKPSRIQENINPLMNTPSPTPSPPPRSPKLPAASIPNVGFDAFAELNPFTVKDLDTYRMQLWRNVAQDFQYQKQQQPIASSSQQQGLAALLRPAFFTSSSSTTPITPPTTPSKHSPAVAALLSGKGILSSPSSSTSHPLVSSPTPTKQQQATMQQALVTTIASQTLLTRMGSAFWDAFSKSSSSSSSPTLDTEKVRRVLEGKAVVRVVDIDEKKDDVLSGLEEKMKGMALSASQRNPGSTKGSRSLWGL